MQFGAGKTAAHEERYGPGQDDGEQVGHDVPCGCMSAPKRQRGNKTKQNKTKQDKTRQNKTKQDKTRQNRTKIGNKTKRKTAGKVSPQIFSSSKLYLCRELHIYKIKKWREKLGKSKSHRMRSVPYDDAEYGYCGDDCRKGENVRHDLGERVNARALRQHGKQLSPVVACERDVSTHTHTRGRAHFNLPVDGMVGAVRRASAENKAGSRL